MSTRTLRRIRGLFRQAEISSCVIFIEDVLLRKSIRRPPRSASRHIFGAHKRWRRISSLARAAALCHSRIFRSWRIGAARCRGARCVYNPITSAVAAAPSPRNREDHGGISLPISALIGTSPHMVTLQKRGWYQACIDPSALFCYIDG